MKTPWSGSWRVVALSALALNFSVLTGCEEVPGGADGGAVDASNPIPPDTKPDDWTLNRDSAPECPETPPVIPIIGGPCLGVYYSCGWTHPDGRQYSCTCDWVHWLCI